eukprot:TRINITY_DN9918_c0_g1_i2.p1 TRINITY_DN9918_c0_g1~~TRINITY_DN9918_c0_g1_i2.p1  ORF type:complete len:829 (+),score=185.87 TRINITY_DN9918_c0_g1_i2:77-2563(+)
MSAAQRSAAVLATPPQSGPRSSPGAASQQRHSPSRGQSARASPTGGSPLGAAQPPRGTQSLRRPAADPPQPLAPHGTAGGSPTSSVGQLCNSFTGSAVGSVPSKAGSDVRPALATPAYKAGYSGASGSKNTGARSPPTGRQQRPPPDAAKRFDSGGIKERQQQPDSPFGRRRSVTFGVSEGDAERRESGLGRSAASSASSDVSDGLVHTLLGAGSGSGARRTASRAQRRASGFTGDGVPSSRRASGALDELTAPDPLKPAVGIFGDRGRTQKKRSVMLFTKAARAQLQAEAGEGPVISELHMGAASRSSGDGTASGSDVGRTYNSLPALRQDSGPTGGIWKRHASKVAGNSVVLPAATAGEVAFAALIDDEIPFCADGDDSVSSTIVAGTMGRRGQSLTSTVRSPAMGDGLGSGGGGGAGFVVRPLQSVGLGSVAAAAEVVCEEGDDDQSTSSSSAGTPKQKKKTAPSSGFAQQPAAGDWDAEEEIVARATAERPEINLGEMQLTEVPVRLFADCAHVVSLDLSGNELASLPDSIGSLVMLETLNVKSNNLTALPDSICDCASLAALLADQNELSALPEHFGRLTSLEVLGLDWNDLRSFPEQLTAIIGLQRLYLCENPALLGFPDAAKMGRFAKLELHIDNAPALVEAFESMRGSARIEVSWNKVFPDKILDFLYLGSLRSAQEPRVYRALGIGYLASIGRELSVVLGEGMQQLQLNVDDLSDTDLTPMFDKVHEFIEEARSKGTACLVHCFKGQSRSATMVMTYLMKTRRMGRDEALEFVRQRRPMVNPNPGFMQLMELYETALGLGKPKPESSGRVKDLAAAFDG